MADNCPKNLGQKDSNLKQFYSKQNWFQTKFVPGQMLHNILMGDGRLTQNIGGDRLKQNSGEDRLPQKTSDSGFRIQSDQ